MMLKAGGCDQPSTRVYIGTIKVKKNFEDYNGRADGQKNDTPCEKGSFFHEVGGGIQLFGILRKHSKNCKQVQGPKYDKDQIL